MTDRDGLDKLKAAVEQAQKAAARLDAVVAKDWTAWDEERSSGHMEAGIKASEGAKVAAGRVARAAESGKTSTSSGQVSMARDAKAAAEQHVEAGNRFTAAGDDQTASRHYEAAGSMRLLARDLGSGKDISSSMTAALRAHDTAVSQTDKNYPH